MGWISKIASFFSVSTTDYMKEIKKYEALRKISLGKIERARKEMHPDLLWMEVYREDELRKMRIESLGNLTNNQRPRYGKSEYTQNIDLALQILAEEEKIRNYNENIKSLEKEMQAKFKTATVSA